MHLSRSTWRRFLVLLTASAGFVLLYSAVIRDSLPERAASDESLPVPGSRLDFVATAYCKGSMTATGTRVGRRITGIAAADPDLLPLGSIVSVTSDLPVYNGIYAVLDTGPAIQGRILDIYMWSCYDALDFGRRSVELRILRLGWDPGNTEPSLVDPEFLRREADARARGADQPLPRPEPEPAPAEADAESAGAVLDASIAPVPDDD
jgi:3D (Asp-Asp-Asp) domain-containing protein